MKERLLITTAIGLMLGTGAFAQSPSDQQKNNPPPAAQSQTNQNSATSPAPSSTSSQSSAPSAQNAPSTSSDKPSTTTSQSTPNTADTSSQAQSNQTSAPSQGQSTNNAATAPSNNAGTAPSQAQSTQPPNAPSQAQTNTAPPTNTQTQAPAGSNTNTNAGTQPSTNTNTAAQPSNTQSNTAQSSSSNVSVSASLNETQRSESIARLNVAPLNNVNFSLSVGTVVPRDVRFQPLPADVVEILPQYRGYNFLVVRDDIVIVDPSTYKIVDVLPRTGRSTAAAPAPAPSSHKMTFSDKDREVIRKHARSSRVEQRTAGSSTTTTRVRVGERLPESVEIRSFPETVYRESPTLRDYRYIERDNRTYVIEPRERTIIEEID
jgi:Protein of unknown function (DUF1236)